ncbi:MAG: CbiX/SirB N-terminal domain-containing protein [Phycisphaerae bacterium]
MTKAPLHNLGIILVDHGSRLASANAMLDEVTALFRKVSGYQIVEPAHMEIATPSIADAFAACVRQGATRVVIHPYFLSPGRHSTTDIPRLVAQAARHHRHVPFHVTRPLGVDEKIAQVIMERITACDRYDYSCDYCRTRGEQQQQVCSANRYTCKSCAPAPCPNVPQ